jgi:hypothetical protein
MASSFAQSIALTSEEELSRTLVLSDFSDFWPALSEPSLFTLIEPNLGAVDEVNINAATPIHISVW